MHLSRLDHLLEHLDLAVFLINLHLVLLLVFLALLLMPLLNDPLLVCQLLGTRDQLANIIQSLDQLLLKLSFLFLELADSDLALFLALLQCGVLCPEEFFGLLQTGDALLGGLV